MDSTLWVVLILTVVVIAVVFGSQYLRRQAHRRAWSEMASRLGLECELGSVLFSGPVVTGTYRGHNMVLDTFTRQSGSGEDASRQTYTRIVLTASNPAGLRLTLHEKGVFSQIGKLLGAQDIQVGDADIDRRFVIKGSPQEEVKRLFAFEALRLALLSVSSINLSLEGSTIRYEHRGVEKGIERLHSLIDLLSELATAVEQIG